MLIHDKCKAAGVVGAGGAGFPTHVKLNCKADIVLGNGAECEPLLRVDQQLMKYEPELVVEGMKYAIEACGAKEGKICIKGKHKEAVAALEKACAGIPNISVFILNDYYPAGDEQQMVYDATGRIVPVGGIPIDAGAVVQNVTTLKNIALAQRDIPVTHRRITITGEVKNPITIDAPIGMSLWDCVRLAGGPEDKEGYGLICGGPMMGFVEKNWDNVVTKTTSGLIVLPKDHPHYRRKSAPQPLNVKMAKTVCCQCMQCTSMCPRDNLSLGVKPHMAMRAAGSGVAYTDNGLFSCCNCGICSYYACPFDLSPSNIMTEAKGALAQSGVKPIKFQPEKAHTFREYGKVPVHRLVARLGLKKYNVAAPLCNEEIKPGQVRIPLKMHIGAPCDPIVTVGQSVKCGDCIAKVAEGKLGVDIHASINGTVKAIEGGYIVIG